LKILPFLLLIGVGISLVCGLSVISGASKKGGVFLRTARVDPRIGREIDKKKKRILNLFIIGEIAMGVYLYTTVYGLWSFIGPALAPWLLSTGAGFFFVASYSLIQRLDLWKNQTKKEQQVML
jgi:hypothetical protein